MITHFGNTQIDSGPWTLRRLKTLERRDVEQQLPRARQVGEVTGDIGQGRHPRAVPCGWRGPTWTDGSLPDESRPAQETRRGWWDALRCILVSAAAPRWIW